MQEGVDGVVVAAEFEQKYTELVVGAGGAVPVAELHLVVVGLPVVLLGLLEPPVLLRDTAELVVCARSRRWWWYASSSRIRERQPQPGSRTRTSGA
jgi:hypothetical protein